ncbi:MAG: penicillin acylase family protein, partial [Myxococcales bacterium]|nr:penicillin acylase family protein [Myxococcales bacterium]
MRTNHPTNRPCTRTGLTWLGLSALVCACGEDPSAQGGGAVGGSGGGGGHGTGGVTIPELTAPVDALYDDVGILHLRCATDVDCYAALGYFHAQNRFFFMDFVRNTIRGTLGALVKGGEVVLERDAANRSFFATREGEPLAEKVYADASPEVKAIIDAYSRGVNAWIADMRAERNGATLTAEYDFALIVKEAIREWEPADSAAVGLYIMNDFSNKSAAELKLAAVRPFFDQALAPDLFTPRPVFEAPAVELTAKNDFGPPAPTPGVRAEPGLLIGAGRTMSLVGSGRESITPGDSGSNNWVLSGSRAEAGHPLLANDPHIALTNPSVWFPVEIDAMSFGSGVHHVAGSSFPGLPSVIIGHNEWVAWGLTASNWDLADVYVEELTSDGSSVRFEGAEVPVIEKQVQLADASTGTIVERTLRWVPHHGPIVAEDRATGVATTVRWTGHDGGTDLDAFFAIGKAHTVAEARAAIELVTNACQNFVVADMSGDVGLYPFSKVPNRPWASAAIPPWLPLPGDGTAEWQGTVSVDDLPEVTNPASGVVVTANQDLTGASADGDVFNDGAHAFQAITRAEGTRARRIMDLIEAGGAEHNVASMTAILGDSFSLYGTVVVPEVLTAAEGQPLTAAESELVAVLGQWGFTCPTGLAGHDPESPATDDPEGLRESAGCSAFHALLASVTHAALADEIAVANGASETGVALIDRSDVHLVLRALRRPEWVASGDLLWDDVSTPSIVETKADVLRRGLSLAAEGLAAMGSMDDWRWGRSHTFSQRSIYDAFGISQYNDGPFAAA